MPIDECPIDAFPRRRRQHYGWLAIAVLTASIAGCARPTSAPPAGTTDARSAAQPAAEAGQAAAEPFDPFWNGLARNSIQLDQTLLVVKGSKGVAGCTYLNVDTFERTGEPCVIIPAADFDGMLDAKVSAATSQAEALGIEVGMPGREALDLLR